MEIVIPKTVTDAVLISHSVPETDHAAYNAAATYATGDQCIVAATHRIYKSLKDANTNHYPPDNVATLDPWWADMGPTNRWRMFDDRVGTVTTGTDLQFVLDSSKCDVLALFGLTGGTALVETLSGGDVVESVEVNLASRVISGWYGWVLEDWTTLGRINVRIPLLLSSQVRVTISGAAGCGNCVIGRARYVGLSLFGSDKGMTSFSRKDTDSFGYTYVKKGELKEILNLQVDVNASQRDYVESLLRVVDGIPAVFLCDNRRDSTLQMLQVYGALYDWRIVLAGPNNDTHEIRIESLI